MSTKTCPKCGSDCMGKDEILVDICHSCGRDAVDVLTAECDAALAELAALKAGIAACFKCHADLCGGGKYSALDFATEIENLKPGWYALYPVPTPEGEEEFDA